MRRIVILGCSGSGKSTLARAMGQRLGVPVVHLDVLYWEPGWRHPDTAAFLLRVGAAVAGEDWITEGNYRETFPLRLPRADVVIWLHAPRWLRLLRVIRRLAFHRSADLPSGCPERWDWGLLAFIWRFERVTQPRIEAARREHGSGVPVIHLRNRRAVGEFLASLPSRP